jgi:UDP-N-acetylglucosamine/UDP-N-acetyl-alpha-D-glucosaminouronate 4-epimerase
MSVYGNLKTTLAAQPQSWLITGVAGFIGSHLLETLLKLDQRVIGFDNFSTGYQKNLEKVRALVGESRWPSFQMVEGDICDGPACRRACKGVDFVLHQAALGSVPRSLADPLATHENNVTGFVNMAIGARDAGVKRFVFASSSAVYGDEPNSPKVEEKIGAPLSPYAASKIMNETYAGVFARAYDFSFVALRYFNVFGPRQDPEGAYAAVIPKWTAALLAHEPIFINGDGETSRDFCYIENVVQANLLAATSNRSEAINQTYNIALGQRTTLNELLQLLKLELQPHDPAVQNQKPIYRDFRPGDVRHSLADINKARRLLGYEPEYPIERGLEMAMDWYRAQIKGATTVK